MVPKWVRRMAAAPVMTVAVLTSAAGQQANPAGDFMRDFAADQKRIWTAPMRMSPRQAWTLALPLVAGTVALKSLDRSMVDALPGTPAQRDWSRRVSLAGSMAGLTMAAAATTAYGHAAAKPAWSHLGRDAALALASGLAVTYAIKGGDMERKAGCPRLAGLFLFRRHLFPLRPCADLVRRGGRGGGASGRAQVAEDLPDGRSRSHQHQPYDRLPALAFGCVFRGILRSLDRARHRTRAACPLR